MRTVRLLIVGLGVIGFCFSPSVEAKVPHPVRGLSAQVGKEETSSQRYINLCGHPGEPKDDAPRKLSIWDLGENSPFDIIPAKQTPDRKTQDGQQKRY